MASRMAGRFRGFLPVVVDVETGGFNAERDALLEIGVVLLAMDGDGFLHPHATVHVNVAPFPGANLDPRALEVTGIDPDNPLRGAVDERQALEQVFQPVRAEIRSHGCQRAVLVGHNAHFDLGFINAAVQRTGNKRSPFHPFSCFDTATLAGLAYGQTVLSKAVQASGREFSAHEAHAALYDAERTATLFCDIVNRWHKLEMLERDRVGQML